MARTASANLEDVADSHSNERCGNRVVSNERGDLILGSLAWLIFR
jgi:hypothetical protein